MHWRPQPGMVGIALDPDTRQKRLVRRLMFMIGLALSLTASPLSAAPFRSIIVIGDSLSDTGNVSHATDLLPGQSVPISPPYFAGHFSNGPMWIEALAEALGLQVTSSAAGGTNFAYGGAKTGPDIHDLYQRDIGIVIPSLRSQVTLFRTTRFSPTLLDPLHFDQAPADALYVVWGGANDLREMVLEGTGGATPARIADDVVSNLVAVIRELQDDGAVYFLVPNLPNLGRTPQFVALGPAAVQLATALSTAFNTALAVALDHLENTLPIHIARLDILAHLDEMTADPQRFGLTNVLEACLDGDPFDGGTACADPDGYIFWDAIGHPTTASQAFIADFASQVLPPLVTTADAHNTEDTLHVSDPVQGQPVLHVRLSTTNERVRLSRFTVRLAEQQGGATRVKTLKATLRHDTNANGTVDAGEVVLATRAVQGIVNTLTLPLTPPLDLLPNTVAHILVTLDINGAIVLANVGSATDRPGLLPSSGGAGRHLALIAVFGSIGMLGLRGRRPPSPRFARVIVALVVVWCLALTSCDTSNPLEPDARGLTVSLPAAGLDAEGDMSGALNEPAASITGATISLVP